MAPQVVTYPALDQAIRSGAWLVCGIDANKGAPGRLAWLWCERTRVDLALGAGPTFAEALQALEQDLLSATPIGPQVSQPGNCWVCAMNALVPAVAGSGEAVSALDGFLLASREFHVNWHEGQFHFTAQWTRRADALGVEVKRRLIEERVPSRWRHGEHVWEYVPVQNHRTGAWVGLNIRVVSRPASSKQHCPCEKRRVEVMADTLGAVLASAEERLARALREDEEWLGQTTRCT